MTIDFDDGYIDPESEYAKNHKANLAMGDDDGIVIGNCYYTHDMIRKEEEKRKAEAKNKSSSGFFDPYLFN